MLTKKFLFLLVVFMALSASAEGGPVYSNERQYGKQAKTKSKAMKGDKEDKGSYGKQAKTKSKSMKGDKEDKECEPAMTKEGKGLAEVVQTVMAENHLPGVIFSVMRGKKTILTQAFGTSMTDVPATTAHRFRSGNLAFPFLSFALLSLCMDQHTRNCYLDDALEKWLPGLEIPERDKVTLRMLITSTSGYADYVKDEEFEAMLYQDPFRSWTPRELIDYTFRNNKTVWYEPGTNFNYAHGNFVLLGLALEAISKQPLDQLLEDMVLRPSGLFHTSNSFSPSLPEPALHSFTTERGAMVETTVKAETSKTLLNEDATFWNPSWTTARGAVQSTNICDAVQTAYLFGTNYKRLISSEAHALMTGDSVLSLNPGPRDGCPEDICLAMDSSRYYAYGMPVSNGWLTCNPMYAGLSGYSAHDPKSGVSIAVAATRSPSTPDQNANQAGNVFHALQRAMSL